MRFMLQLKLLATLGERVNSTIVLRGKKCAKKKIKLHNISTKEIMVRNLKNHSKSQESIPLFTAENQRDIVKINVFTPGGATLVTVLLVGVLAEELEQ